MKEKKAEPAHVEPPEPPAPEPTACAVCGLRGGEMNVVKGHILAHVACATARPDVIAKVKARA